MFLYVVVMQLKQFKCTMQMSCQSPHVVLFYFTFHAYVASPSLCHSFCVSTRRWMQLQQRRRVNHATVNIIRASETFQSTICAGDKCVWKQMFCLCLFLRLKERRSRDVLKRGKHATSRTKQRDLERRSASSDGATPQHLMSHITLVQYKGNKILRSCSVIVASWKTWTCDFFFCATHQSVHIWLCMYVQVRQHILFWGFLLMYEGC